ncbi:hypothetical protein ACFPOE_15150 [Caenimonas terrae]|uniref:Uncharacterized protein n=1 Tax=Caenimonas terrae TaxID=696074 RepID=A0ABW0NEW8_9BURK
MTSLSQPSQASASTPSGMAMAAADSGWSGAMDDIALGCECADPALQIAMWGLEAGDAGPGAVSVS